MKNPTFHLNIILTKEITDNVTNVLKEVKKRWPDYEYDNFDISITIINRNTATIDCIKTLANELGYKCGKNIYELSYFNEEWPKSKLVNEVFKILPKTVYADNVWIVNDTNITVENYQNPSHKTVHNIYGLWDKKEDMPMFMKTLRYDMQQKNTDFRYLLHDADDISKVFDEKTWQFFNEKISRKVVLADISRYFLMWKYGGFYLDLDVRVADSISPLIKKCLAEQKNILLFTEHDNCNPEQMGPNENKEYTQRIYNCMCWSLPGESFWKDCIDLCKERCEYLLKKEVWSDVDILWASGPDVITTIYHSKYKLNNGIKVISNEDTIKILRHMNGGTWRNNKDLKN